jgi:hypothetical protein
MGAFVPKYQDSPDHMSGVAVYPGEVINYAGLMLMSVGQPVPFDLIAAPQVAGQAHFTDLIQHRWSPPFNVNPPFTSVEDMKSRMTSECVLYHSDKTGSIIDVLGGTEVAVENKIPSMSGETVPPSQNGLIPWNNKIESLGEISRLCKALKTFCSSPSHIHRVRQELLSEGVIKRV